MKTREVEAAELEVGMVLVGGDHSEREITRVKRRPTSVTVLLDGITPYTFRNLHEIVRVTDNRRS